ncbi:hypothetical protein DPMN_125889 [Dreissena polymorpha]|uniref:Uncharacterized protein n=1 Tax=Dreissena polymorpha TaxID=45954 RepID=A0A9D4JTZ0_DREPO|nr:hypothetical protein DPMN_125889 [Dreissena polymorpha]
MQQASVLVLLGVPMKFSSGYGRKSALHPGLRSTRISGGVVRYRGTMCQALVVLKRQGDKESVPRTLVWITIRAPALGLLVDSPIHVPIAGAVTQPLPASKSKHCHQLEGIHFDSLPKVSDPGSYEVPTVVKSAQQDSINSDLKSLAPLQINT